jgi:alanyl-tRNA synthetase
MKSGKKTGSARPSARKSTKPAANEAARASGEWTAARIRKLWTDFFQGKKHLVLPSASLLPSGDPTLLFNTAGMVPFKAYFAGTQTPPSPRVATIQKCLRTTDLESVGKTERHCTFFEMLGNFSFGDYFKRESIKWAYEFSLEHLKLDPEQIYVTVYTDDDEAEEIWNKEVGVPMERIRRLGKDANWWGPAGDSGACGPCSELYLDRGVERCNQKPGPQCGPGCSCDRFMEYWNLVFNQFHQDTEGKLHPLPQTGIDTGAGLERITMLKMQENSVYDTDEMRQILHSIEELTAKLRSDGVRLAYDPKAENAPAFRVLTDHSRAASFAIADGIFPDNAGRGYVIRRIIRRALLFAQELGIKQPVLYRLVPEIVRIYGGFYPEIKQHADRIEKTIRSEEERFLRTLEQGIARFADYLEGFRQEKSTTFGGREAFRLYDTFGFPLEMTVELAEKQGLAVDLQAFNACMKEQRERAAKAAAFKDWNFPAEFKPPAETKFTGYASHAEKGKLTAILIPKEDRAVDSIDAKSSHAECILVLDRTPFYPEGGGQVGDTGQIVTDSGVFVVHDTRKKQGLILHMGEVTEGTFTLGDVVQASIDQDRRESVTGHHSATHLLNAGLRQVLGSHVLQTGSLVSPDYLRFDFSHGEKIPAEKLREIESHVNHAIAEKADVSAKLMGIDEAKKAGALATFGEKYGTEVRVISMGQDGRLSRELCGGCHVNNTGAVQYFYILKESSPGAGNRRIEAVAGQAALRTIDELVKAVTGSVAEHNEALAKADLDAEARKSLFVVQKLTEEKKTELLGGGAKSIAELRALLEEDRSRLETAKSELAKLEKKSRQNVDWSLAIDESKIQEIGGISVLVHVFEDANVEDVKLAGDSLKGKHRQFLGLFGIRTQKGPVLVFMANKGAVDLGADCGKLIREAAQVVGGGGGGKPDMAQAGGKDASRLEEALALALGLVKR